MSAIIRIKRPSKEDPIDALLLNCKRRKTENANEVQLSTVVKFAGTVKQEEDIIKHIKKPTKTEFEEQYKKHIFDITAKLKSETQEASKTNRYKVVNCRRSINVSGELTPDVSTSQEEANFTIVDVEASELTEAGAENVKKPEFVYDLYYTNSDDFGDEDFNELLSIYPLSDNLVYGSHRDNGVEEDSDAEESDDSNAEMNWRNDYPDESDLESITEDDMLKAMNKVSFNGDNDLSSDESFVYGNESEGAVFTGDVDEEDVLRYGETYARYKASVGKKSETSFRNTELYCCDIDEEEYYY